MTPQTPQTPHRNDHGFSFVQLIGDTLDELSRRVTRRSPVDPTPDIPAAKGRTRGVGGRTGGVGANEILARADDTTETPSPAPADPAGGGHKIRVMSFPPDVVDRVNKSSLNRADLLLIAADRFGDQLQHIPRRKTKGRARFVVSLNDEEHARLQRIAKRRGWHLSPTAATLLDLYLTEIEQNMQ